MRKAYSVLTTPVKHAFITLMRKLEMENRLETVQAYLELDFSEEKILEDLVFLASEICGTPIAAITFVDDKKQYPVVRIGEFIETSCDIAICNHTIKETTILEVPNTLNDPRFSQNPLVTGNPFIRFYAGIPLVDSKGATLGALCVIAREPKKLSEKQIKSLQILSKQVMERLELQRNIQLLRKTVIEYNDSKELVEQAELMKKSFYDASDDFYLLLNTKLEIVSFNSSANKFFEKNGGELQKGKNLLKFLQTSNLTIFETPLKQTLKGENCMLEFLMEVSTTGPAWIRFVFSPSYNTKNELIGIACIGSNIDKEKLLQDKINLQNLTLNQIAKLHSHEIRHPLTNILAIIKLIKKDGVNVSEQFIDFLELASKELDDIIKNIVLDSNKVVHAS